MSIFEDVKASVTMRQVVEHYGYKVNRAGKFLCPFHADSHPSASIKSEYFKCFVCGAGGDVITFVARLFGLGNMDAAKKIIADFALPIQVDKPLTTADRLRADRQRQRRLKEQREREEREALVSRTGRVLADYYYYLQQGVKLYPADDVRHIRGIQELTQAEYYLECYDAAPEEYSIKAREQVDKIEHRLKQYNEREPV